MDAPYSFYTALTFVILGYFVVLFPVILILCIIFCLPVVLLVLRLTYLWTGIDLVAGIGAGYPSSMVHGTTAEILSRIPVVKY